MRAVSAGEQSMSPEVRKTLPPPSPAPSLPIDQSRGDGACLDLLHIATESSASIFLWQHPPTLASEFICPLPMAQRAPPSPPRLKVYVPSSDVTTISSSFGEVYYPPPPHSFTSFCFFMWMFPPTFLMSSLQIHIRHPFCGSLLNFRAHFDMYSYFTLPRIWYAFRAIVYFNGFL